MSQEVAEFPFPSDVTDDERATARREIAKYAKVLGEEPRAIRFEGRWIGQTGPIWRFQYLRMYQLHKGYLIAGHELREGIKVAHADSVEGLSRSFENEGVQEFVEDELKFRGVIGSEHASTT
ncbi:MAG: hypothetical protein ACRDGT_08965 [Candidatus Limnocylindria bacterium]